MARLYTDKQMGDACEMLVAAELTLSGVPALKVPDNWPAYDVIAQHPGGGAPQRISVKSRTFKRGRDTYVDYKATDEFDWLAIVLLRGDDVAERRVYIVPRSVADDRCRRDKTGARYWVQEDVPDVLAEFRDNYRLSPVGTVDL